MTAHPLFAVPPPLYEDDDPGFMLPEELPRRGPSLQSQNDQDVANELVRTLTSKHGAPPVFTDGSLWRYDGTGLWVRQPDTETRNLICSWNGAAIVDCNGAPKLRKDKTPQTFAGNQAKAESSLKRTCDMLEDLTFFDGSMSGVMFSDRFVRVTEGGDIEECAPSPECRAAFRIDAPYPSDPTAVPYGYVNTMLKAFGDDDEDAAAKVAIIQEWLGLAMIGRSPNARALMLVGPERSGKSVTAKIGLGVFPPSVRASIPLKSLDPSGMGASKAEYYLAQLAGVRINADLDLPGGAFVGGENFKKIVTGEGMTGRHPSGRSFSFTPRAAMLFAGESLPNPEDKNRGFFRRWLVIRYRKQVDPRQVVQNYEEKVLKEERALIAAWFIQGAAASIKRGEFAIPPSVDREIAKWVLETDHTAQWCALFCVPAPNMPRSQWQPASVFYEKFRSWSSSNGQMQKTSNTFSKDLKRCLASDLCYEDRNGTTRWGYRYEATPSEPLPSHPGDEEWVKR